MKGENRFRQPWIEGLIRGAADGCLHATVPDATPEKPRTGPVPYTNELEIKICLECPRRVCALDKGVRCVRLKRMLREAKEKQKEDTHNGDTE